MQRIATALANRARLPGRGRPGLREPWWIRFNRVCRHTWSRALPKRSALWVFPQPV